MKIVFLILFNCLSIFIISPEKIVNIEIDANCEKGELKPIWAWFGYDEPNYTYMNNGKKLLKELAVLSPVPVYVRAHNLLTTGDVVPYINFNKTLIIDLI